MLLYTSAVRALQHVRIQPPSLRCMPVCILLVCTQPVLIPPICCHRYCISALTILQAAATDTDFMFYCYCWAGTTATAAAATHKHRDSVLQHSKRCDGRRLDEVRRVEADVSVLPVVHGSALFSRGQTQALVTVTLGPR
jgi:hypothetical protein